MFSDHDNPVSSAATAAAQENETPQNAETTPAAEAPEVKAPEVKAPEARAPEARSATVAKSPSRPRRHFSSRAPIIRSFYSHCL